ncbi:MAG: PadR family transcriptional regulator [Chloroflexi bacterium]|nr:PadR family transcriptional regulator [Chloroflexota bacterium]
MSVKYAILALLYQRQMHGYELGKQLALALKTDWDVKPGQIASTLARLEQAELVEPHSAAGDAAPDRKIYHLTEKGVEELRLWYLTAEVREYRSGDAFYLKLVFSLTGGPVTPEQVLRTQRRRLYQELHDIMALRRQVDADSELPLLLLLETVILHLEADLRWIEMCEGRLDDLKRYRPPKPQRQPRGRPKRDSE